MLSMSSCQRMLATKNQKIIKIIKIKINSSEEGKERYICRQPPGFQFDDRSGGFGPNHNVITMHMGSIALEKPDSPKSLLNLALVKVVIGTT